MIMRSRFSGKTTLKFNGFLAGLAMLGTVFFPGVSEGRDLSKAAAIIEAAGLGSSATKILNLQEAAVKRYAIVIGNGDYEAAPDLKNSVADAKLMAEFLRDQGYLTHEYHNVTKLDFEAILRQALFDIDKDTEVVFYFAGHGVQIGDTNFIVPVNAALDTAYDVPFEAVSLESLVNIIGARARSQLLIFDSCRDDPFNGREVYTEIGKNPQKSKPGFSAQSVPDNSLLAYATSPGGVAFDGDGANSPYTISFVRYASSSPNETVSGVLGKVRTDVKEQSEGKQIPWEKSSLIRPMYFDPKTVFDLTQAGTGSFSSNSSTRSLALLQLSLPTASAITDEPDTPDPGNAPTGLALVASMDDEVDLGSTLEVELPDLEVDEIQISEAPSHGLLAIARHGDLQTPLGFQTVTKEDLDNLIYIGNATQVRAADLEDPKIVDEFTIRTSSGEQTVELTLEPNPCDFQAGDYLDPEGVGFARYPNEIEPEEALKVCRDAVSKDPENGRFHYQLGRALLALRKFDQARLAFERSRDLGHSRAWYALGDIVAHDELASGSRTGKQASELALALFEMGVSEGDPYAFYALGRELMRYEAEPERQKQGFDLMMRALEVGHTFAMNELGYFYLNSKSQFYDPERGLRYLRESAARNDIYGYNNMGIVFAKGLGGVEPDMKQAFDWYLKAAEGGHPKAPTNLGRMYYKGQVGSEPDLTKAIAWYDKGLERGDAWAGANSAWILANKTVPGMSNIDAANRAAKAKMLRNEKAGAAAEKVLKALPKKAIDAASQQFLVGFGQDLTVDGAFGAGSRKAMDQVAKDHGLTAPKDPQKRLEMLAQLYWEKSKFRVDLY